MFCFGPVWRVGWRRVRQIRQAGVPQSVHGGRHLWSLVAGIGFSPVPSLLLAITCLVNIANVRGLKPVGIGVLWMGVGVALMGLYTGYTPEPRSSLWADLLAFAVIVVYVSVTGSVSKLRIKIAATRAKLKKAVPNMRPMTTSSLFESPGLRFDFQGKDHGSVADLPQKTDGVL